MLMTLAEVVTRIDAAGLTITQTQLVYFAEQQWVRARQEEGAWYFDEQDAARAQLICEMREDMAINDEAMPLVLRLLDQVYALRGVIGEMQQVLGQLPAEERAEIEEKLRAALDG
ncbi:chaperone modulator CbpM [Algihabitans albus]|uniref:chaperone modulator CbpM n=1 Tax=Algihabitans albus TaxID=2164067 RepID=UPI000E5C6658|nr:chaperone modulator CbpM [Algihabitans albus]